MPRLAANISLLFADLPAAERPHAAARAGFAGVEMQFVDDATVAALADRGDEATLPFVLINAPPGARDQGELGFAGVPGAQAQFDASLEAGLARCASLGCPRLHVLSGRLAPGTTVADARALAVERLAKAAAIAHGRGVTLLIEPFTRTIAEDYVLTDLAAAQAMVRQIDHPALRLQFDTFHVGMMGLDPIAALRDVIGEVGHVQIAGVPTRNEPDTGTVDHHAFLAALDNAGHDGWVGCEYSPAGDTKAGLGWAQRYLSTGA